MSHRIAAALATAGLVACGLGLGVTPASAATTATLQPGQSLASGQSLDAGGYRLTMQKDGNLVEYHGSDVVWASDTDHHAGSSVIMERNGNLVVYGPGQHFLWGTTTNGDGNAHFTLQSDGNAVVYQGTTPVWAQTWRQRGSGAQKYAQQKLGNLGWSASQMNPLLKLWNHESNWTWDATNPDSGAYGIPQSLPADKMASFGADWHDDGLTQAAWGLRYIKDTYGTPAAAWAFWQQHHYY